MFNIIPNRRIFFFISTVLVLASLLGVLVIGFNVGIDFKGGSLLEVKYSGDVPAPDEIKEKLSGLDLGEINVQASGEKNAIIRMKSIDEEMHLKVLETLGAEEPEEEKIKVEGVGGQEASGIQIETKDSSGNKVQEERFSSIGPVIGQELKQKSAYAIIAVVVAIILYIAWAFRAPVKGKQPISSWKYGVIAVITLAHDIMIVVGVFILLGYLYDIEINTPFIAALLTILGYSVNDTIVVFDRIRENLPRLSGSFESVVNTSVNQTIMRSVNTSLTTLLVLGAIFFFGGVTIKYFVLALIAGVLSGTYSSIFLASPFLVVWEKWKK